MPTLHGANLSPFVRKVRVALAEKGIAYESVPTIPFGASPEFLKLSPLGKIPVYQDGDFSVPDSSVIIDYLERTHPKPALYPTDPKLRARALFLEEYADTRLVETVAPVFFQRFVQVNLFKKPADEAIIKEALEVKLPPVMDFLEATLGDNAYAVGGQFSVADIALTSPFVNFALVGETVDAKRWPRFAAYLSSIHQRPAYKPIVEGDLAN